MLSGRQAVLVQDEFEIQKPCEVAWGVTTDAQITAKKEGVAVLTFKGRKLIARILSPAGAKFIIESAEQKRPQKTNKGVNRLIVRLPDAKGQVRVAILLSPVWKDGYVSHMQIIPLEEWRRAALMRVITKPN